MLEYWRQTYFHIGQAYGISVKCVLPQHQMVRKRLGQEQSVSVAGRKAVVAIEQAFDIVLIDATETPIEHPP
jgi:hypothetical protein